jgi:flagellar motor switch/type III secretory pathway protein FliN
MAEAAAALKKDGGNEKRGTAAQEQHAQKTNALQPGTEPAREQVQGKDLEKWAPVLSLPCDLTVELPIHSFKVADLMRLQPRTILESHWHVGEDVPLRVGGQLIGWGEFEVVADRLSVRITELR